MQFEFESCDYCDDPHELEILVPVLPSSQTRLAICRHPDPLKLSLQRTRNLLKIKKKNGDLFDLYKKGKLFREKKIRILSIRNIRTIR